MNKKEVSNKKPSKSKRHLPSFYVPVLHEDFLNQLQNVRRLLKKEIEELGLDSSSEPYIPILKVEYNPNLVESVLLYIAMQNSKMNSQNELDILGITRIDDEMETRLAVAEVTFHLHIEEMLAHTITMLIDLSLLYASDERTLVQPMIQPIINKFVDNTIKAILPMREQGGSTKRPFDKEPEFLKLFKELYPLWRNVKKVYTRIKRRPQSKSPRRNPAKKSVSEAEAEYIELLIKEIPQAAELPNDLLAKLPNSYDGEPKRLAITHACRELEITGIGYRTLERIISKNKQTLRASK